MAEKTEKIVQLTEAQQPFSKYPEAISNILTENQFVISSFPDFLLPSLKEPDFPDTQITSVEQLTTFLKEELDYWNHPDLRDKIRDWSIIDNLGRAQIYLEYVDHYISRNDIGSAQNSLRNCLGVLRNNILNSRTALAQTLWNHKDRSEHFFNGFYRLIRKDFSNNGITDREFEGAFYACIYINSVTPLFASSQFANLKGQATKASQNYADLNKRYLESFQEQEKRLNEIANSNDQHLKSLTEKSENFWNENASRRDELEKVYREKLRLEAPAKYWDNMADDYKERGNKWLKWSIGVAVALVVILLTCFFTMSMAKTADVSWFGIIRNYVILTATVGIGVYMLRLCVRMCMSCYHQARDAEERSKLASFYLALIEKGAVTDKERALVINSLFSRADTGLLKGDSTPVMSQNVTELVDAVIKK